MVFQSKNAHTWKCKLAIPTRNDGKVRTFTTGTTDRTVARAIERFARHLRAKQWSMLEPVFDGQLTLRQLYEADAEHRLAAELAKAKDIDLEPYVRQWQNAGANAKYIAQVRVLMPKGVRFPRSEFRRARISSFLADLSVSDPTRNRYRAALSQFARWLVEREILETNPVRDVRMAKERAPRMAWMSWADAARVCAALESDRDRALIALATGAGLELGAILRIAKSDVDLAAKTVHAHGSKTTTRDRVCVVEAWAWSFVERLAKSTLHGRLFDDVGRAGAYKALRQRFDAAQAACGLSGHRIHDCRHTYAVNALKAGHRPQAVATQLGHKDASMVHRNYGRYLPDASDYAKTVTNSVTSDPATASKTGA